MQHVLALENQAYRFRWDLRRDRARLGVGEGEQAVWEGSLLPLFWLADATGARRAIKAVARVAASRLDERGGSVAFLLEEAGEGTLHYVRGEQQLRFTRLEVNWAGAAPRIVGLYFGCDVLTPEQRAAVPTLERPFWPTWQAWGFGVASAKTAPMQSFFRRWDFGHANIALGSFGPAMGTPYAAAFPRPTLAAGMGNDQGIVCFGAGELPDAALTLQIRSSSGCVERLYREDLWGGPEGTTRVWDNPLWLSWDANAWLAYRRYFRALPQRPRSPGRHQKSFMGTWGDFRRMDFNLRATVDRAADDVGGEVLCIDDAWESFAGSGEVHAGRLPHFEEDLAYARARGLGVAIWQSCGWIGDYERAGLTRDDVTSNAEGRPMRTNWALDPYDLEKLAYCFDPSSERTLEYLRQRTRRIMERYRPSLLKLDFSYGLPGPDACAPRDPQWRGERWGHKLLLTIAEAAKTVDPAVTILGYSINPLWDDVQDQVSLDDLGDAGPEEAAGHGHWGVWASLVGDRGLSIMASSGYEWDADAEILLNTAIIGAPGMNLPRERADGHPPTPAQCGRRLAVARWYRRTAAWEPLWLDSAAGNFQQQPQPRNWGRVETGEGEARLTALALREPSEEAENDAALRGLRWTGRWAVIAQNDGSIFDDKAVALVPFASGDLRLPRAQKPARVHAVGRAKTQPWERWRWQDGVLVVEVDEATCASDLLGLIVENA